MNCPHFKEILLDIIRTPGEFEEQALMAKVHAEECVECAALMRREMILSQALQSIAEEEERIGISEVVGENIQSSFRERFGSARETFSSKPTFSWVKAAVIAALVLGGLILVQIRSQKAEQKQTSRQNSVVPANQTPVQSSEVFVSANESNFVPLKESSPMSVPIRTQRSRTVRTLTVEVATEFIPLVPSDQTYGSLQRVRVMLPRNSLLQFGLPMNEERAEEPIVADLLVGEDGAPRAIRFVQDFQ